ncbi:preprotein translocase subunit SecY [Candidatus Uhrbacteria bacterium RIFOXYC2_FULL_47_19]|uniref:Protein translocase subunit SecY n=1 Tax=Candidatus Uhrbacteria bacterium RIFOXYC2_FULL_47_19 TaxID=1802424 RepID=A0A1F7WFV5_9BACT|nr:MAG: preprotein translocase subunit SecY [Candidatus Uhrbacteria bacterium RIFOXYC2_FULL_47_19]
MLKILRQIWKTTDLRYSVLFVLLMLVIFRVAAHIPIPGVDTVALKDFFDQNQVLGMFNVFSGGTMESFSIVALGVGPYITASIIFQLLAMIVPRLEEMQKEGQSGQEKINQYTRLLTVPLALLQGYAMISLLRQTGNGIIAPSVTLFQMAMMAITMTTGTVFLMWIGELISERKIGNGISIMIFAGIISGMPTTLQQALVTYDSSQVVVWVAYVAIALATIAGVVLISEGQRNIPVVYAKRMRGNRSYGGAETFLPLRVNMAGVIPIIFAISIILLPPMIGQFFVHAKTQWLALVAQKTIELFQNQLIYGILYFVFVFGFTYFYTAVIFHPDRVAENLQKQGGYVPGIRPGRPTAEFIQRTINRIMPAGAFFLAAIAILPIVMQQSLGTQAMAIGGTSLLIVVSVVIEIVNQINSQLTMREYESL